MARIVLEDMEGSIEVLVFPNILISYESLNTKMRLEFPTPEHQLKLIPCHCTIGISTCKYFLKLFPTTFHDYFAIKKLVKDRLHINVNGVKFLFNIAFLLFVFSVRLGIAPTDAGFGFVVFHLYTSQIFASISSSAGQKS